MTQTIQLEDGRALELHEFGDPDGFPIVFHHVPDVHAWLLSHS